MIQIAYNNVNAYVRGPVEEISYIVKSLEYIPKGARFFRNRKARTFFSAKYQMFPSGLLSHVTKKLHALEIGYELIDRREKPSNPYGEIALSFPLRDYQEECVKTFVEATRGYCNLMMRSGKTVIGVATTQYLNCNTLFVVNTKDLLEQTVNEYHTAGNIEAGIIGDGNFSPSVITVGMVQSLSRKIKNQDENILDFLKSIELLIFDECHSSSDSYQIVSRACRNAFYRFGLSATVSLVDRTTRMFTEAMTGPLVYTVSTSRLVEDKKVAKPKAFFLSCNIATPKPELIPTDGGIFEEFWRVYYQAAIVENQDRNYLIALLVKKLVEKGYHPLVLVESIAHGENLLKILKSRFFDTIFVSGKDNKELRAKTLAEIQEKRLQCLIATKIFSQGVNIPKLSAIINAGGLKSKSWTFQKFGRSLTAIEGKSVGLIFDFMDKDSWKLEQHSWQRFNLCKNDPAFDVFLGNIDKLEKLLDK